MALTTSQLLAHFHSNPDASSDAKLGLSGGSFTRHRMSHAYPDEFPKNSTDTVGIWYMSYSSDSEEYLSDKEFLKWYPDELGEVWTLEED